MNLAIINPERHLSYFRALFNFHPEVDEHEFSTAYVNYVESTGKRPAVSESLKKFSLEGVIA